MGYVQHTCACRAAAAAWEAASTDAAHCPRGSLSSSFPSCQRPAATVPLLKTRTPTAAMDPLRHCPWRAVGQAARQHSTPPNPAAIAEQLLRSVSSDLVEASLGKVVHAKSILQIIMPLAFVLCIPQVSVRANTLLLPSEPLTPAGSTLI